MSTATLYVVISSLRPKSVVGMLVHEKHGILAHAQSTTRDWLTADLKAAVTKECLNALFPEGYQVQVIEPGGRMPSRIEALFFPSDLDVKDGAQ